MAATHDLMHQFYDMLLESQYWPAQQLVDYQRSQLEQLLRHARANVPFYERRLDVVFARDGSVDWDRWGEIPIVKRVDLAERGTQMLAKVLPPGHGPTSVQETSGSTGLQVSVTGNRLISLAGNCLLWRAHGWNALDWSRTTVVRAGDDPNVDAWPAGTNIGRWAPPWLSDAERGVVWRLNRLTRPENVLEFIARRGCSYLNTGTKTAHALALEAERLGLNVRLDAILAQGEHVDQSDRDACRRAFGAKIVEHYSSKESGQMAHPCPDGTLHVNSECVLLEILDSEGRPCAPGIAGRVIVTPFFSTAQPLIRYEQGDMAIWAEGCACQRCSLAIQSVVGRTSAIFSHPDGRVISRLLPTSFRDALQCSFWQIAQVGPTAYEVRYVPKDWNAAGDERKFIGEFRAVYFDDSEVTFMRLRAIPPTATGKYIEYVNEWSAPGGA